MTDQQSQLEKARAAKKKAIEKYGELNDVCGVGITRQDGKYAVKINLSKSLSKETKIPKTLNGVSVVLDVVGEIKKQDVSSRAESSSNKARTAETKGSDKTTSKKTGVTKKAVVKTSAKSKVD